MKKTSGTVFVFLSMFTMLCGACKKESDCSSDECCAVFTVHELRSGRCIKLGKEKSSCNLPEEKLVQHGGKYMRACPCSAGYKCKADIRFKEFDVGPFAIFMLKCHKTHHSDVTTQLIPEKSSTDEQNTQEIFYEEISDGIVEKEKIIDVPEDKSH